MKMADLLRQLADKLDSIEGPKTAMPMAPAAPTQDMDHGEEDNFIPPLQQKLELLKKGVGVESEFDDEDELDTIKKNAGINPAVIHAASDDEPLE